MNEESTANEMNVRVDTIVIPHGGYRTIVADPPWKYGKWGKAKILLKTVERLLGVYKDEKPVFIWQDYRFHKSRKCGYIPVVGCIDSTPFRGPTVVYAGELDITNWKIDESIISYKN